MLVLQLNPETGVADPVAAAAEIKDDTFAYNVGFEAGLPAGFGFAAAYKGEELDNSIRKVTQDSYQSLVSTGTVQSVSNQATQLTLSLKQTVRKTLTP